MRRVGTGEAGREVAARRGALDMGGVVDRQCLAGSSPCV